jgi:hypothetical protein
MPVGPNFFVVGAPKSGTSSLYEFVRQHPDIFVPRRKELHYFSRTHAAQSYYRPALIRDEDSYLRHFKGAERYRAAGDFSPSYLYFDDAALGIKAFCSEARILAILRHPTDRTISHYLMDVAKGFQNRPLVEFVERTAENAPYYFEYISTSCYAAAVARYFEVFGRERVLILTTEELERNAQDVCRRVFGFVDVNDTVQVRTDKRHNAYSTPRFGIVLRARTNTAAFRVYEHMPSLIRAGAKRLLQRRDAAKPDLRDEREMLDALFAPEIDRLSEVLGRDMASAWARRDVETA